MSDSRQSENPRVLGRAGARNLSEQEVEQIRGGQNQTFAFTHVINPDTTHD